MAKRAIWPIAALLAAGALSLPSSPASAAISDCKIKTRDSVNHQRVGWPRDPDIIPSTGTVKFLIVSVDFEDAQATTFKTSDLSRRMQLGTIKSFYKSVSNDIFKPVFDIYPSVVRMPKSSEKYGNFEASDPLVGDDYASHLITHEALDRIKYKLDLTQYSAVIVDVTGGQSLSGKVAFALSSDLHGKDLLPGDIHNEILVGDKALETQAIAPWRMFTHEINHLLGIPDLYLYSADGFWQGKSPGPFGQQGFLRGDSSSDSLAYNRWLRGWILESRVLCVKNAISGLTFRIESQNLNTGNKELILYRISDTKVIAFESPKNKGFFSETFPNSLLIYLVDSEIPIGEGPIRLIPKVDAVTSQRLSPSLPDWERFKTAALLPGEWVKFEELAFINKPLKSSEKFIEMTILTGKAANPKTIICLKNGRKIAKTGFFLNCPSGYVQIR